MFSAIELESLVCGEAGFDVELLKSMTIYEGDVSVHDDHIKYFWSVLSRFSASEKAKFVRFAWARTRLPSCASAFTTKFKIQVTPLLSTLGIPSAAYVQEPRASTKENPDSHLPQSHTCFFSISLPAYSSEDHLRRKLLYAISHCQTMDRDLKLQDSELYDYDAADIS
jgi:hypothetical protein